VNTQLILGGEFMIKQLLKFVSVLCVTFLTLAVQAQDASFDEAISGLEKREGLLTAYVDTKKARVLLELEPQADGTLGRYVYAGYLTAGLGSNPVGLDRSRPSESYILAFHRAGDKVMAVIENHSFKASANNPMERKAVETSFAQSIIWSTKVLSESGDGKVLIDFSKFLTLDTVGVAAQLKRTGQGSFKIEADRSYVDTSAVFAFPKNLEFDAHVTFSSKSPGREVQATTPVPEAVTLILHTTIIQLPDDGYTPRAYDERGAMINTSYTDMSAPLDGNTVVNMARRFRLQKNEAGEVINPIVFYIDNGAPEPIRSALLEGAKWWSDAFDAAGFPGGYRAEILPEGVHPLDARYNVVNWVHRATRGWSYGATIADPRTGEVLRGVVLLGSLRVRQDIKIFEALAGAAKTGTGAADDPVELALARIRQLSAHEIGHPLGFSHNMAASTYGKASVMDYPAPDVRLAADGSIDFSKTYGVGVGAWDKWATNFLYADYDDSDPMVKAAMITDADAKGLIFVADRDSRSIGTNNIKGSLWDNGADAVIELNSVMKLRVHALNNFGSDNLRKGEDYSALQSKFVPLYLYHRYQMQAATKFVGGSEYLYRVRGDGRTAPVPVKWSRQLEALDSVLATISPKSLAIGADTLAILSPRGSGSGDPQFRRETFTGLGGAAFSQEAAASAAIDLTFDALMHPARLQRLAEQKAFVEDHEGITGVLNKVRGFVVRSPRGESQAEVNIRVILMSRYAEKLIAAFHAPSTGILVRAPVRAALLSLKRDAESLDGALIGQGKLVAARIENALAQGRTPAVKAPAEPQVPPGSPIGAGAGESCWHC
jgi:hypothetical protein